MGNGYWTELTDRAVFKITGDVAEKFLQDLITNDLKYASEKKAIHAGLLTPQGKILFDFFLLRQAQGFLLETNRNHLPDLMKRITFYKLRANLTLSDQSDVFRIVAFWGKDKNAAPAIETPSFVDPRYRELGRRFFVNPDQVTLFTKEPSCIHATQADYHRHRIALGVPEGGKDYDYQETFPHEANFDYLSGIDFKKGCYIGQEVVSRMHHRGTVRKRIICVKGTTDLPGERSDVFAKGQQIGILRSVDGMQGLALIRLDRAMSAQQHGHVITAGSIPIHLSAPAWASPDFLPTYKDVKSARM